MVKHTKHMHHIIKILIVEFGSASEGVHFGLCKVGSTLRTRTIIYNQKHVFYLYLLSQRFTQCYTKSHNNFKPSHTPESRKSLGFEYCRILVLRFVWWLSWVALFSWAIVWWLVVQMWLNIFALVMCSIHLEFGLIRPQNQPNITFFISSFTSSSFFLENCRCFYHQQPPQPHQPNFRT